VVVPLVITFYVLSIAVGFLFGVLSPFINVMEGLGLDGEEGAIIARVLAVSLLTIVIFVTGFVTRFRLGKRAVSYFDALVESVPGLGAIYASFRQMGDVLLESDNQSFREVYLVEFPYDDSYVIGFQTTETVGGIEEVTDEEMLTLFLPLAPNPMMGGFLAHIPEDRVFDIDMTVQEGIRSIATLGIATGKGTETEIQPPVDLRGVVDEYAESLSEEKDDTGEE